MPATDLFTFVDSYGNIDTFRLYYENNYFSNELWDTDGDFFITNYYADFEHS